MAPAQGAGRILNFFRKPLLIMPCCGNNNYITEPTATRPEEPDSTSQLNRLRPSSLQTEEVPVSRREEPDAEHPYHCPICMDYFSVMNRTMCCKHHLCGDCAEEILNRIPAFRAGYANSDTGTVREVRAAPCPHCGDDELRLSPIRSSSEARNYTDSPATTLNLGKSTPGRWATSAQASPLRAGESYENMVRKMITYEQCGISIQNSASQYLVTPGKHDRPMPAVHESEEVLSAERRGDEEQTQQRSRTPSSSSLSRTPVLAAANSIAGRQLAVAGGGGGRPPLPLPGGGGVVRNLAGSRSRSISPLPPPVDPAEPPHAPPERDPPPAAPEFSTTPGRTPSPPPGSEQPIESEVREIPWGVSKFSEVHVVEIASSRQEIVSFATGEQLSIDVAGEHFGSASGAAEETVETGGVSSGIGAHARRPKYFLLPLPRGR